MSDDDKSRAQDGTPLSFRYKMIRMGLESEMRGMRLTGKAPPCFTIIAKEFGIKVKRGSGHAGKYAAYVAYCERFGFTPKPDHKAPAVQQMPAVNAPGDLNAN